MKIEKIIEFFIFLIVLFFVGFACLTDDIREIKTDSGLECVTSGSAIACNYEKYNVITNYGMYENKGITK